MYKKEKGEWVPPDWMQRIYDWRERMVDRFYGFLRLRVVRIPLRVLRRLIMVYLFIGGLVFAMLIKMGIDGEDKTPDFGRLTLPSGVGRGKTGTSRISGAGSSFVRDMDSIRADAVLGKRLDSLVRARPGFADTIRRLEELYSGDR